MTICMTDRGVFVRSPRVCYSGRNGPFHRKQLYEKELTQSVVTSLQILLLRNVTLKPTKPELPDLLDPADLCK